ncbi:hypothetical protein [Paracoccus jiaweipingae]|uniref:hypothetical protein n=1 Tax=unclassified Paracoccus (in: a-proteobacteria) TaxID=2688777 RepID=UPI0037AE9A5C
MSGLAWDFLGLLAVGIGAAALVYAAMHAARKAGRPLPRILLPLAIGGAMLGFAVWNEYTWFDRVRAQLPDRVVVLDQGVARQAWRPWTLAFPVVARFTALDRAALVRGTGAMRSGQILFVERWQPTRAVTLEVDCDSGRQRMVGPSGATGDWLPAQADHPALRAICDADLPAPGAV